MDNVALVNCVLFGYIIFTFGIIKIHNYECNTGDPIENRGACGGGQNVTIRLGFQVNEWDLSKPAIWIDAGLHAREWITHSTAIYLIYRVRVIVK